MANLDVEKILNGTPDKAFLNARESLAADYNETTANEFFYTYCDQPLSFILRHSREIFSETYFGYSFYLTLMKKEYCLDPRVYEVEAGKIQEYIDEANSKGLPKSQVDKYVGLLEMVIGLDATYTNLKKCFNVAATSENAEELFEAFFDRLYETHNNPQSPETREALDNIAEGVFGMDNVYCKILCGYMLCCRDREYTPFLVESSRSYMGDYGPQDSLADLQRLIDCVTTMLHDDRVVSCVKSMGNLMDVWYNLATRPHMAKDIAKELSEKDCKRLGEILESEVSLTPDDDSIYAIGGISNDSAITNDAMCAKYDNLSRLQGIYSAKAERASVEGGIIAENAEDIVCSIEEQLSFMEWEDDGSPNAVIRNHIMTSKEREELKAQSEKTNLQKSLADANAKRDTDTENESDLCEAIKAEITKVGEIDGVTNSGDDSKVKDILRESRSALNKFRKTANDNGFERALALCDDLEDEIKVSDPMYESYDSAVDKNLAIFLEEFHEEAEDARKGEEKEGEVDQETDDAKPKKPKTDLVTKIQNKALDRAAKDEQRLAKNKESAQKIKNAANAVSSTPKRVSDDLKKFVSDFDKWDDNRRKEFLLKPGYRHKIIKHFKNALMLGSVASVNLACVPFFALCHHCSKLKDKRIRNELARELDNEIHICEEKINDANSAGDNKSKYELMRIKDKLEAEKIRVRVNSNYM